MTKQSSTRRSSQLARRKSFKNIGEKKSNCVSTEGETNRRDTRAEIFKKHNNTGEKRRIRNLRRVHSPLMKRKKWYHCVTGLGVLQVHYCRRKLSKHWYEYIYGKLGKQCYSTRNMWTRIKKLCGVSEATKIIHSGKFEEDSKNSRKSSQVPACIFQVCAHHHRREAEISFRLPSRELSTPHDLWHLRRCHWGYRTTVTRSVS